MDRKDLSPSMTGPAKVAVLMTTYNGAPWIEEQISSIMVQQQVEVDLFISDDQSHDGCYETLQSYRSKYKSITLIRPPERLGSAGRNFFYLFKQLAGDLGGYDFVALADQDDIWMPDKLKSALEQLDAGDADGLSTNVEAFWSNHSRRKLIRKDQPQTQFDYLFESPGPGCTFVVRTTLFEQFQQHLLQRYDDLSSEVNYHDWLLYAYARSRGSRWLISNQARLLYRQHERNELGANAGWRALTKRLSVINTGAYRTQVEAVHKFCYGDRQGPNLDGYWSRIKLIPHTRRRLRERLFLAMVFVLGLY